MRSVWLCSRNDAIGNVVVMIAAAGVWGTGTAWPDLGVAALMAGVPARPCWSGTDIGVRQNVLAADLVVEGVEAVAGFCLRFRVQRPRVSLCPPALWSLAMFPLGRSARGLSRPRAHLVGANSAAGVGGIS